MNWAQLQDWFLSLGEQYGVNPLLFGAIYVGAIPFFTLSVAWLVRNARRKKPITLPALCAGLCFISAYLYLFIAGENIPVWVYGVVLALIGYGAYSAIQSVRQRLAKAKTEQEAEPVEAKNA